jgi:hypothetical protein
MLSLVLRQQQQQHQLFVFENLIQIHLDGNILNFFLFPFHRISGSRVENPFSQSPLPTSLFGAPSQFPSTSRPIFSTERQPTQVIKHLPPPSQPIPPPVSIQKTLAEIPEPTVQPVPLPVSRRLSVNSMDTFVDEIYEQMIDPLIRETTYNIFE